MRVGIAADHGGFGLKEDLRGRLAAAGHDVIEFGAFRLDPSDDYPGFVAPLARAVAAGKAGRGLAVCGSGVGATVSANRVPAARACLSEEKSPRFRLNAVDGSTAESNKDETMPRRLS